MQEGSRNVRRKRRHLRVRKKVVGTAARPRLCVFRSSKNMYAQLINDEAGHTLAAASTLEAAGGGSSATVEAAREVGKRLAERATARGLTAAVFDRGGYQYHGRVRAIAEGAREGGLDF
ncbi:50S ribosomal protein L18 [Pasteuria penetrans]|uniref:50S ribosomal protein L18 n=1 Tax=Pasteuria penetrans TaxID=86005 RepID=UPI000FA48B6F|nr:50S ribosomal protein L18 [Pasteuria penetrans]